jgi:dihydrofolate reductase
MSASAILRVLEKPVGLSGGGLSVSFASSRVKADGKTDAPSSIAKKVITRIEEERAQMSRTRVAGFAVSLDGFSAGVEQSLSDPLGKRGTEIFQWFFHTRTFCSMHGQEGGSADDIDDEFAHRAMDNFGAFILGRNMFGPVRGTWLDNSWKGWWGDNPPYHAPTFVLTHHEREPLVMEGGTTFYFVTGGIDEALERAKQVAGQKDVKIGGGVSTVRQYLKAGLIDSLHLASVPVLLGQGELLFAGLNLRALGFSVTNRKASEYATHLTLERI